LILDKDASENPMGDRSESIWDVYLEHAVQLVGNNEGPESPCIIIADYFSKPRRSSRFFEEELKTIPGVVNAVMLESETCAFVQVADILTGCVAYEFRRHKNPERIFDNEKCKLSGYLAEKLGRKTLFGEFVVQTPLYFEVTIKNP
jgi:hypothetical protein